MKTKIAENVSFKTLEGHTSFVSSLAFNPDGETLASGSWDNTIRLWNAITGECRKTLTGHTRSVTSLVYSPDGRTLASASEDLKTIHLWDAATGDRHITLKGHTSNVKSLAFSPDGSTLASASWDETICLWDAATGKLRKTLVEQEDWWFNLICLVLMEACWQVLLTTMRTYTCGMQSQVNSTKLLLDTLMR